MPFAGSAMKLCVGEFSWILEWVCIFMSRKCCCVQDVLSIAVGPRDEDEEIQFADLESLLEKLSQTLRCRKVT